jgi:hypothetical protein
MLMMLTPSRPSRANTTTTTLAARAAIVLLPKQEMTMLKHEAEQTAPEVLTDAQLEHVSSGTFKEIFAAAEKGYSIGGSVAGTGGGIVGGCHRCRLRALGLHFWLSVTSRKRTWHQDRQPRREPLTGHPIVCRIGAAGRDHGMAGTFWPNRTSPA